jgi:AraC-like DNA-binding protein
LIRTITDIIAIITVAQLILFAIFLISTKKDRGFDKIVLALFLISNGIFILNFLAFSYYKAIAEYTLNAFFIGGTFGFLFGPLLYLYTKAVTDGEFRLTKNHFLHFVPFIVVFCLTLIRYQFQPYETKLEIFNTGLYSRTGVVLYLSLMHLITLTYLVISFLIVRNKNLTLKGYYSSLDKINFNWLKLVVSAFFIMWIVDLVSWIAYRINVSTNESRYLLAFISLFINFAFANLLILKSLRLPEPVNSIEKHKYEKSPLTIQTKNEILAGLGKLMSEEKLYLNSSLNLGDVAQRLSVVPRYLSQVINELKGQNFYDFVNSYRIEEAKKILGDPAYNEEKILSVLYECGFNSKSVFNTAFKKYTGLTPSGYRRKFRKSA